MKLVVLTLALFCLGTSTAEAVGPKLTAPTPGLRIIQLRQFIAQDRSLINHPYRIRKVRYAKWERLLQSRINTGEIANIRAHYHWAQRLLARYWSMLGPVSAWMCIHSYEGSWQDAYDPYWGGLQMDKGFQRHYGSDMIRAYGALANRWHPYDQMIVATRAYLSRGFYPWPNTARYCGLI